MKLFSLDVRRLLAAALRLESQVRGALHRRGRSGIADVAARRMKAAGVLRRAAGVRSLAARRAILARAGDLRV